MPWTCGACGVEVAYDEAGCPECAAPKTSWTIVQDMTRTIRVPGKKVAYLRGELEATRAPTLATSIALELARQQQEPDPLDVLTVRLFPGTDKDWTVGLTIEFEGAEAVERDFPREATPGFPKDGHHDVRFLFVHGPADEADLDTLEVPGVDHVVDLSEDGGKAPWLELTALKKPPRRLSTDPAGPYMINARLFDATGRVPVRDTAAVLATRECKTDSEGFLLLEDVDPGRHALELLGGVIDVPASHHREHVVLVRLPFHEASADDLEAHPSQVKRIEPAAEDAPVWLPTIDEEWGDDGEPDELPYDAGHGDPDRVEGAGEYLLNARFFDRTGRAPVCGVACTVEGQEHTTDDLGVLRVDDVGPGRHDVAFEGGVIDVPASHHADCVINVRLPFHEASDEALDAHPRQRRAEAPRDDDPPAWLPLDPADQPAVEDEPGAPPASREVWEQEHGDRATALE